MLWPHQQQAVQALLRHPRFALWWEQGCGKTAPLIVAGQLAGGRQLWITLASLRLQTAREIRRWRTDRPRLQVILHGDDKVDERAAVVIVSFDHMRMLPIWKQLFALRWDVITVDEAHRLAAPGAKTTKAFYGARVDSKGALFRRAERVWLASGTPIVNWPNEIWTHVSRLWPEQCADAPTYADWRDRFCHVRRTLFGEQIVGGRDPAELKKRLRKTGLRLRLQDAVDMPPILVDEASVEGADIDLSQLSEEAAHEVRLAMERMQGRGNEWELEQIDVLGSPVATLRRLIAEAKAAAVAARVEEELQAGADRVLVFGCHVEPLRKVAGILKAWGAGLIIGETPPAVRDKELQLFNEGRRKVLVGNVQSMGTGLNIQAARRAVFLDASWSPAQNAQAIGRIYRAGQQRPCHVTFYGLAGSVDDDVQRVLARKARFARKLENWE